LTTLGGFRTNITEQQLRDALSSVTTRGRIETGKRAPTSITGHPATGSREVV